jgi:hypothetical protein
MAMKSGVSLIALAASAAAVLALSPASAQSGASGQGSVTKEELAQNFQAEHEIGRRFHIDPNDLPAPKTGPIVTNRSLVVPYNGQALEVPPGFAATPFATRHHSRPVSSIRGACWCCPMATYWSPSRVPAI